jgi:serine protease Do
MPINDAKFIIANSRYRPSRYCPASWSARCCDQFLKTGHVHAGTAGLRAQRVTKDLAAAFGLDAARGAIITEVDPKGPAAGKLRTGDIILRVNDQDASDMPAVARLIAMTPAGEVLHVQLLRGGAEQSVAVTVAERTEDPKVAMAVLGHAPAEKMAVATPSHPGMGLTPLTEPMRARLGLPPDDKGVVVTDVAQDGVAARRRIMAGDVIEAVGDHPVSTPEEVQQALKSVSDRHLPFAPLLVRGEHGPRWVPLELEADR